MESSFFLAGWLARQCRFNFALIQKRFDGRKFSPAQRQRKQELRLIGDRHTKKTRGKIPRVFL
jgi:hypothetical protein